MWGRICIPRTVYQVLYPCKQHFRCAQARHFLVFCWLLVALSGIGTTGLERRALALGRWTVAKHLGARRVVKSGPNATAVDRLQQACRAQPCDIPGVFGHLETHLDVTLRPYMVDLDGLEVIDQMGKLFSIH
jgi:hypothetical protein